MRMLRRLGFLSCAMGVSATSLAYDSGPTNSGPKSGERDHVRWFVGPPTEDHTVGHVTNVVNKSDEVGYGTRFAYFSYATKPGFDLATADISISRATDPVHTAYAAHWFVQVSPQDDQHFWSATIAELNPVNRGNDPGWTDNLSSLPRVAGGLRVVPETKTFGEPGMGRDIEFAYAIAQSGTPNATGQHAKTYNGLMVEANSIAANGRGVLEMGASTTATPAKLPATPLEIRANWRQGLTTVDAKFAEGNAIHLGTGQAIALTDDGKVVLKTDQKGHQVQIFSNGKRMMSLDLNTGNLYLSGKIIEHSNGPG